jgi:hypothetical protein
METRNQVNKNENEIESDSQKIIHRHLNNKDDIITDEDIRNVRVGSTPAVPDEATLARFEEEKNENTQITPWDLTENTDE